ncbi:hypothetical protein ABPG74_020037 [Tetrahymena malaccensis]
MGHRRFRTYQNTNQEFEIQHKKQKIDQYIENKIFYLTQGVDLYVKQQQQKSEQSLRLLQFNPKIYATNEKNMNDEEKQKQKSFKRNEDEREIESKIAKINQQMRFYENLKSYIKKKLLIDNEKDENLEEKNSNQIFETRKKLFKNQFKNIENIFNLNYYPKLEQLSSNKKQNECVKQIDSCDKKFKKKISKWFIFEHDLCEGNIDIQEFQYHKKLRYSDYSFEQSNQMEFNPYVKDLDSFHNYNDYVQTSLLEFNSPITVLIHLKLDQPLSLLSVIQILLSLKSYNIIQIYISNESFGEKTVPKLIELLFRIIFSQRNLQQININSENNDQYFQYDFFTERLSNAMSQCDLENSQIRINLFYQISRIKMLYHFSTENITIDENSSENFYRIINKVTSIKLHQMGTELNFNNSNLQSLDLDYKFSSQNQVYLNYNNFKSATKLQYLKVNSQTQIISTEQASQISRKEILQKKNNSEPNQNYFEKNISDPNQKYFEKNSLDILTSLTELQILNIEITNQCNIIDFISQSQALRKVKLVLKDPISLNYINLLQILDTHKTIHFFILQQDKCQPLIMYEKKEPNSIYYDLSLRTFYSKQFEQVCLQNMKSLVYDFNCEDYKRFDKILQTVKKSQKIRQLTLKGFSDLGDFLPQLINEANDSQYELFSHLIDLKELEILEIDFFFKQQLLNSLSNLIQNSRSLKSLSITRTPYKQAQLDYSQLFKSLSNSKTIEQVYINLAIEQINQQFNQLFIQKWKETKIKHFYQPLCQMIQQSQNNLLHIQLLDDFNEEGMKLILASLLTLKEKIKYVTFSKRTMIQIKNQLKIDKKFKELFDKVNLKGYLVDPDYDFQIFDQFFSSQKY